MSFAVIEELRRIEYNNSGLNKFDQFSEYLQNNSNQFDLFNNRKPNDKNDGNQDSEKTNMISNISNNELNYLDKKSISSVYKEFLHNNSELYKNKSRYTPFSYDFDIEYFEDEEILGIKNICSKIEPGFKSFELMIIGRYSKKAVLNENFLCNSSVNDIKDVMIYDKIENKHYTYKQCNFF